MKPLNKITILISLLLATSNFKAQTDTNVIFFDYIPDTIINSMPGLSDTVKIDINLDGTDDLMFYQKTWSFKQDMIKILHANCQFAFFDSTYSDSLTNPSLIYHGSTIGSGSVWPPQDDRGRIAVRLIDGADYYYGWIRAVLTYDYPRSITIDKYAFCKIANYPFLFGQTELATSVNEILNEHNTQVYFNGSTANIVIQSDKQLKEVKLVNMLGATVKSFNNVNALNTNISTNNLAHGNYIVQVKFKDASVYAVQVAF